MTLVEMQNHITRETGRVTLVKLSQLNPTANQVSMLTAFRRGQRERNSTQLRNNDLRTLADYFRIHPKFRAGWF